MANTYTTLNSLFTGIADAIRAKKGSLETIVADTFPIEIENLKTGFDYSNQYITSFQDYAFYGCEDLKSIDCSNVTSIGNSTFENCKNLQNVILWDKVETIGENAFKGCSENLTIYCMFDSKPENWHENWNPDNREVVWRGGAIDTWNISATSEDNVTAKMYTDVFNEGMYTLTISGNGNMTNWSSGSNVPWYSNRSSIKNIVISQGVTSIGNYAFYKCTSLTSREIPNSVTSIGTDAFDSCTILTSITFGESSQLTSIGNWAFGSCKSLKSISIPEGVTTICDYAFTNCTILTSIELPNSVTSIGRNAFYNCSNLTSIEIPDSITSIDISVFNNCSSLTSITIPDGVTSIGGWAFYGCISLTSIEIPNSVTSIDQYAFYGCSSLTNINYTGTISQWQTITFETNWNYNTPDYIIYCTDGNIAKDGTITYHNN